MPDFDVEAFVTKLDSMGMKLTAVPLADGKVRINRWRTLNACEHTQQIQNLWAIQIGNNQERIDVLAAHLANITPRAAIHGTGANRMRIGSQPMVVPDAASGLSNAAPDALRPASQSGATSPKPPATQAPPVAQTPLNVPATAVPQPAAAPQRVAEKAAGVSNPPDIQIGPELHKLQTLRVAPVRPIAATTTQPTASSPTPANVRGAAGLPVRSAPQVAASTSRLEGKQAASEERPHPGSRQDVSDTRRTGDPQKVAGTPSLVGLQRAADSLAKLIAEARR